MVRTQVLLKKHQHVTLKELSREQGISLSELVRMAVDKMLAEQRGTKVEQAKALLGAFTADVTDGSVNHDHYVWQEDE